MAILSFSSKDVETLNVKFTDVHTKLDLIHKAFQSKLSEITNTVKDMKATGGTILDNKTLNEMFEKVQRQFADEQKQLKTVIDAFQKATEDYEQKRQALYDKEEEIIARESEADANFASKRHIQLAPLHKLKVELDAKQLDLIKIQNEYNDTFMLREKQLVEDYKKLNDQLQTNFSELQERLIKEREILAKRENALSLREQIANQREAEILEGLAQERSAMMSDIEVQQNNLYEFKDELRQEKIKITEKNDDLLTFQGELQKRQEEIYQREREADEGFVDKNAELVAQVEKIRQTCLNNIALEEKKASEHREEIFKKTFSILADERQNSLNSLQEALKQQREEADEEIQKKRNHLAELQQKLEEREQRAELKDKELKENQAQLLVEKEKIKSEQSFIAEKTRIDEKKFRKIAQETIEANVAELQAVKTANSQITSELVTLRLKYEEQKAINERFRNETAEEIYARLQGLEVENNRLMAIVKNAESKKDK